MQQQMQLPGTESSNMHTSTTVQLGISIPLCLNETTEALSTHTNKPLVYNYHTALIVLVIVFLVTLPKSNDITWYIDYVSNWQCCHCVTLLLLFFRQWNTLGWEKTSKVNKLTWLFNCSFMNVPCHKCNWHKKYYTWMKTRAKITTPLIWYNFPS